MDKRYGQVKKAEARLASAQEALQKAQEEVCKAESDLVDRKKAYEEAKKSDVRAEAEHRVSESVLEREPDSAEDVAERLQTWVSKLVLAVQSDKASEAADASEAVARYTVKLHELAAAKAAAIPPLAPAAPSSPGDPAASSAGFVGAGSAGGARDSAEAAEAARQRALSPHPAEVANVHAAAKKRARLAGLPAPGTPADYDVTLPWHPGPRAVWADSSEGAEEEDDGMGDNTASPQADSGDEK
jgi:hypothetical protein